MTLSIPACVLLAVFATPLIRFVYGVQWVPAALPLTMLSIVGVLRIALELGYDYLAAIGRTVSILAIHALWLAGLVPALIVGARWDGIAGVGWGHLVTLVVLVARDPHDEAGARRVGDDDALRRIADVAHAPSDPELLRGVDVQRRSGRCTQRSAAPTARRASRRSSSASTR